MRPTPPTRSAFAAALVLGLMAAAGIWTFRPGQLASAEGAKRIDVPKKLIRFDDGDSIAIHWPEGIEVVRLLAIDTPEVLHLDHNLPRAQAQGDEAAGFLRGCIAVAEKVELLRAKMKDRYKRTLAYLFLDGKNYSVLVIEAGLAYGPSGKFGDNGLPEPYAACEAAASQAGPLGFEEPYLYRRRMRRLSEWMKKEGTYPACPPAKNKTQGK